MPTCWEGATIRFCTLDDIISDDRYPLNPVVVIVIDSNGTFSFKERSFPSEFNGKEVFDAIRFSNRSFYIKQHIYSPFGSLPNLLCVLESVIDKSKIVKVVPSGF